MILQNEALLSKIKTLEADALNNEIMTSSIQKRTTIIKQNQQLKYVYIIKSGIVKCLINEENDKNYVLEFLGPGEVMGEIESITNQKAIATISSITEVEVYKIKLDYFKKLMNSDIQFNQIIVTELATRLTLTATRAASQQLNTIQYSLKKLTSLLLTSNLPFTKTDLSEYLGINIRSLNRELNKIEKNSNFK